MSIVSTVLRPDYGVQEDVSPSPIVRDIIAPVETVEEPAEAAEEPTETAGEAGDTVIPVVEETPKKKK